LIWLVATDQGVGVTVAAAAIVVRGTCLTVEGAVRAAFVNITVTVVVFAVAEFSGGHTRGAAFIDVSVTIVIYAVTDFE
jgi:hypothetical protein